ncbi:MAG: HEPN/Toprim-associated domain-containing protein [Planctomycetota bacterium]
MGSHADLSVAGYPILETKSSVAPEAMTIFRETDKRVLTRKLSERNELVWGKPDADLAEQEETAILYACETAKIIDRLEVMGFSLRRVRDDFESIRKSELAELAPQTDAGGASDWDDWAAGYRALLETLSFERYAAGLRTVMTKGLRTWDSKDNATTDLDPVAVYILDENNEGPLGFFCSDIRTLVRLSCELVESTSEVVQDITELVSAGYYEVDEPVCENAIRVLLEGHPENSPRIILTEGSTDGAILHDTLKLLYPHLVGYYSFLDFESARSQGGAGHLVSIVKAFSAAGITNRVIALFDNDTAAFDAMRTLDSIQLPRNIKVRSYPNLELLGNYPTLGPGGLATMDVNGLAGSIELYLGQDVLFQDGMPPPVQWRGYVESLGKYQGEVMHKSRLRASFQRKIERCRADPAAMNSADWTGLRAIWESVFRAFE